MSECSADAIALVPTGEAGVACDDFPDNTAQVVIKNADFSMSKKKKLATKFKQAPLCYFQVIALGIFLILLIIGCMFLEGWRTRGNNFLVPSEHSEEERQYHMSLVESINDRNLSWRAVYNPFASRPTDSSMDVGEVSRLIHKKYNLHPSELLQDTVPHITDVMNANISIPTSFDSRERWPRCSTVHGTPNQGGCGSCWSVAAAAVMSDRVCISTDQKLQPQISAQDLTSCCTNCGGCQGTHWALSSFTFWKNHGLVTGGLYGSSEGCRPYEISPSCGSPCPSISYTKERTPVCKSTCQPLYSKTYREDVIRARHAYWIRAEEGSSEATPIVHQSIDAVVKGDYLTAIKKELLLHGPVLACFTVHEDFQHYRSGVYKPNSLGILSNELYGHCAKLIGWGEEGGIKYWTYMNTWGREWGENGFFRIDQSEIPEEAVAGLP